MTQKGLICCQTKQPTDQPEKILTNLGVDLYNRAKIRIFIPCRPLWSSMSKLVWFLCLMPCQPLWVIQCQSHLCWRTVSKLANHKVPISIAIKLWSRRGRFSFLWIVPLTLNLFLIMLSVKQRSIKYYILSL